MGRETITERAVEHEQRWRSTTEPRRVAEQLNGFGKFIGVKLSIRYCANDEFCHGLNRFISPAVGLGVEWRG